ncbi:hypothetical protein COLO4_06066 [Corchorus olitorius]|uniref:Uncharacterized protein n=1 Tax=Corchorus olitorius TaxID=93759 RepID=A0A1R3KP20_9ROSI|nr:hypothetical protein COLO4_06066 [Corchorus olitorius]
MRPPSLHSNFFSSLKQVEKRLRLELPENSSSTPSHVPETNPTETESPLYLQIDQPENTNINNTLQDSSDCPQAFLSASPQFPSINQPQINPPAPDLNPTTSINDIDDIECLIQLLGLSDNLGGTQKREKKQKEKDVVCEGKGNSCGCECGFYEKIVGVKGPKCEKEVERMEGWIRYFLKNGNDPLRLAFLLMGKAAFERGEDDSESLEFPCVIDEFLKIDPPEAKD